MSRWIGIAAGVASIICATRGQDFLATLTLGAVVGIIIATEVRE